MSELRHPQQANIPSHPRADPLLRERALHSIVPRESVAGTALVLVIAIMAFLSSLTLGAVSLVNDTARGWQSEIAREITIQVRPGAGIDVAIAADAARQIAGGFSGISSATLVDESEMRTMLEPWLGGGLDFDELPVPRLVRIVIDSNNPPDIAALRAKLEETVPGASLDDHRAWVGRLTTMARTVVFTGLLIFVLMMAATVLTVIFATRGAMAGNRHVIEVLHFIGAEPGYIAGAFQKHFLLLGLKGALAGGLPALLCFFIIGYWSSTQFASPVSEQASALFGTFSVGPSGYFGTLILIFVISLLTAMTSRYTVFRHVGALDSNGVFDQSSG